MGKFYSGIQGSLSVDGVKVGKVRDWSLTGEVEALEATTLDDFARTDLPGRQRYSGNCTLYWYANDEGNVEGSSLINSLLRIDAVDKNVRPRLTLSSLNLTYELDALVTSIETGAEAGGVMSAAISFLGQGPLIQANPGGI